MDALAEQTVAVVGTEAAGLVILHPARELIVLHAQRTDMASHLEAMLQARGRSQDCRSLHRRDLWQVLHQRHGHGLLCWSGTNHPPVRHLDQIRARQPLRQQTLDESLVPLSVSLDQVRPGQPGLLRQETDIGKAPQLGTHRIGPPTTHRPILHDP